MGEPSRSYVLSSIDLSKGLARPAFKVPRSRRAEMMLYLIVIDDDIGTATKDAKRGKWFGIETV